MVKRRVYKGGTVNAKLSPQDIQFTPGDLSPSPNTLADPTRFPDNHSKVAGRGCDGTTSNVLAAEGQYVPMQTGGGGGVCLSQTPLMGSVTGPKAGYAGIQRCQSNVAVNAMALGAGGVAKVGQNATVNPWPGSGGRRKRRTKRRVGTKRKGTKRKGTKRKGTKRSVGTKRKGTKRRVGTKRKGTKRKGMKKSVRARRMRQRGGNGQPYSNVPLSFGYGLGAPLPGDSANVADMSALANPPPQHVYNHCEKNDF